MGAGVGGEGALRHALRERGDDRVGDADVGLGVAADAGRRVVGVHQRAAGRHDLDGAEAARVLRDRGVGEVQDGVVGRRPGDREHGVDRPLRLGVGAAVVHHHLVALHVDVDVNPVGAVLDAVVLHVVREAVDAVLEGGELGPHARLGVVHQVGHGAVEGLRPVLLDQRLEPGRAHVDRRDQRAEVAVVGARRAVVGEQQLPHLHHVLAALLDLDRGHAHALVEDLGGLAGEAARHHAAYLGDVADGDGVAHQLTPVEHRLDEGVLRRVHAAAVGVVVDDHVPFLDLVVRNFLGRGLQDERQSADLRGVELGDPDQVAPGVAEAAGEVQALVEDGGVGGLHHRDAHLAADGHHRRIDDVHGDHVHARHLPSSPHCPRVCRRHSGGARSRPQAGAGRDARSPITIWRGNAVDSQST